MARITVEDCIDKFPSRFELVLVASNRARKLHSGENPTVEKDNDKNTVIALREIAEETLTIDKLKNDLVEEYQTASFTEDEDLEESENLNNQDQSLNEDITEDNKSDDIEALLENNENSDDNLAEKLTLNNDTTENLETTSSDNEASENIENNSILKEDTNN
tara:strand:+ start:20 stop:505 length:486 start_codon:yes stop_codon:yes gene_type:complete